jgi:hypothetical protein
MGTYEPVAPIQNARRIAVWSGEIRGIGFDLVAAIPAPHDEANTAAAATPRVIGGPGSNFTGLSAPRAVSVLPSPAVARIASAAEATARAPAPAGFVTATISARTES